jgi:enoyl-CoA hydratase/carnithine racemase
MPSVLLVDKRDSIATLTLNRPEAMNALSGELRRALIDTFREIAGDDSVGVVILTGAGRAFCAGLDLKELGGETGQASASGDAIAAGGNVIGAIDACPKPIIGAINGFAITGGFELALACDVLIASREARFADTHARVGILPGWGLSQKLPRLLGIYRAKELSLTGNFLSAEKAEAWGLVNRVVEPEALMPACRALAEDMLSCEPQTLRGYKRLIDEGFGMPFAQAIAREREASLEHAKRVKPADVAARRAGIQSRGRAQH